MKSLTIEISPELGACLGSEEEAKREIYQALIMDLLRQDKVSRAKAAELLNIPLGEFPQYLARYRIPWMDYTQEDLEEDQKTLNNPDLSSR